MDGPTERVDATGQPAGHTSEFGAAYGPTEHIPAAPNDYFGQPPGPEATRVMPPYDNQWGGYEPTAAYLGGAGYEPTTTYPAGAGYEPTAAYQAGAGYGPGGPGYQGAPGGPGGPGMPPGGYQPAGSPPPPGKPPRRTGVWIALGLAALALVAVVGVLAGTLIANRDSSDTAADNSSGGKTTSIGIFPPTSGKASSQPLPSGIPQIPGLGDIDDLGANMGTIASNDGTTIKLTTLSGTTVTVHTDDKTQVISLGTMTVKDLAVGEMVMVQGDKASDGSIKAEVIISTSLPGGTR